ncbi:MAG: OsmC family protein [Marinoscillum sp.]
MKFNRNATAVWKGSGKDGKGTLSTPSGVLENTQYSFKTRFEDGNGTNPEELVGAAHAGCFAMQLSFLLNEANYTADTLDVTATVHFEDGEITSSELVMKAVVPEISESEFKEIAEKAKSICPISKLLNAAISLDFSFSNS